MAKRRESIKKVETNKEILKEIADSEIKKEEKLLNLLAEILINSTIKEFNETCNQIS